MDGRDVDLIPHDAINEAVAVKEHLAHGLCLELRHSPAKAWVRGEQVCRLESPARRHRCDVRSIASDEEEDGLQIVQSLERPSLPKPSCHALTGLTLGHELTAIGLLDPLVDLVDQV